MTRKSVRLLKESIGLRSSLKPETSASSLRPSAHGSNMACDLKQGIVLQPGKRWERSLSIYRRMTTMSDHFDSSILDDEPLNKKGRKYRQSVISTMEMQDFKGIFKSIFVHEVIRKEVLLLFKKKKKLWHHQSKFQCNVRFISSFC